MFNITVSARIAEGNDMADIAITFRCKSREAAYLMFKIAMRQLGFNPSDYIDVETKHAD